MSPIGLVETFQRLEDFPSFISCIKCFGRPIIPPLVTADRRHELQKFRIAAINKEVDIFRKKKKQLSESEKKLGIPPNLCKTDCDTGFQSGIHESRALWYPSPKDCPEGISIAISKFPTSGIYSSVHTGAICSNVIESNKFDRRIARHSVFDSTESTVHCNECSHSNINFECGLCQAEYIQNLHNSSYSIEKSPEVPCRTYSLLQSDASALDNEENEETECDSLPTVICKQKFFLPDTDSESNATCMTQSTDLDKYMEFSCDFGSPDNSSAVWDSKSLSQQCSLSRSDDASSETIVNTENELTPCASTMAEFTDNLEDEFGHVEGNSSLSENKDLSSVTIKRAHSVDSYMKIIQACARNLHVKKSFSEPLDANSKAFSSFGDEIKAQSSSKSNHFIKEDSKESDDSVEIKDKELDSTKEMQEGDSKKFDGSKEILDKDPAHAHADSDEIPLNSELAAISTSTEARSPDKKHIRQNSYTLDHPSSVLIQAHADCTCNFDAKCISPHSSSLNAHNELPSNSAFTKEKVLLDIPTSVHQIKKFPILTSESCSDISILSKEDITSSVVDIFPTVSEDNCEKYNSGNKIVSEDILTARSVPEPDDELKLDEHLKTLPGSMNIMENSESQDYFKLIYQEIQKNHEIRVKKLCEEQKRQWLKLQEEFEEQEKVLYEKLKILLPSGTILKNANHDKIALNQDVSEQSHQNIIKTALNHKDDKVMVSNSTDLFSEQIPVTEDISQDHRSNISSKSAQTVSQTSNLPQIIRASDNPSSECKTLNSNPSFQNMKKNENSECSVDCICNSNNLYCSTSQSLCNLREFPSKMSNLKDQCRISVKSTDILDVPSSVTQDNVYFCHESLKQCECLPSGMYSEYDINTSQSDSLSIFEDSYVSHSETQISHDDFHSPNISSSFSINSQEQFSLLGNACGDTENQRKSRTSTDIIPKINNASIRGATSKSYPDVTKLPKSVNTADKKFSQQVKGKFPVGSIISSLCGNTLKNGSLSAIDISGNKKIMIDPAVLKKFEKLPAFVKGYLTRRLFKTERVQSLIKTLQDTALLIGKLSEDLSLKGDSVSERDVDFHRQLIVQLMTTFHNVYDIFCTVSTKERMNIITESRNLRLKQIKGTQRQESELPVATKASAPVPSKKHKLSSATLKALERKRRSAIDNRTYNVEDFKSFRTRSVIENRTYTITDLKAFKGRSRSNTIAKSHSVSPSAIYKNSVGISPKKKNIAKTTGSKTTGSRRCLHLKWVP